jgi:hypothetical protein
LDGKENEGTRQRVKLDDRMIGLAFSGKKGFFSIFASPFSFDHFVYVSLSGGESIALNRRLSLLRYFFIM